MYHETHTVDIHTVYHERINKINVMCRETYSQDHDVSLMIYTVMPYA